MCWTNHWANTFPLGDLLSWTQVILTSRGHKPTSKILYCMLAHFGERGQEPQTVSTVFKVSASAQLNSSGLATRAGWVPGRQGYWKTHSIKQRVGLQWCRWDQGHQQRRRHTESTGHQTKVKWTQYWFCFLCKFLRKAVSAHTARAGRLCSSPLLTDHWLGGVLTTSSTAAGPQHFPASAPWTDLGYFHWPSSKCVLPCLTTPK